MAVVRRRSGYGHPDAGAAPNRRHPAMVYPPDGYCLIEADLHRATTSLEVASFPFLSQLNLRSAINLSPEPLHEKVSLFFRAANVKMLTSRSLAAFDGPYDLWEEAAKEALELLLNAENQPMILIDSQAECESACLVGCLRRLQHRSVCAIHDEYQMLTMRNTSYNLNQRFIERFDLDLVTLNENIPSWFREHLTMLEEERIAEEALVKRDPQRPMRSWTRGVSPRRDTAATTTPLGTESAGSLGRSRRDQPRLTTNGFDESSEREGDNADVTSGAQEIVNEGLVQEEGGNREAGVRVVADAGTSGGVPNFRLNGFVYICPLMTEGCKFTAKAWLQDEDD